ncbi:leucine-rich repeat-containing protein 23 [Genypterus blacodes]|uniref:leucine-rich repeat-containing protein 23 n=1 Tax=Genypterus blacodes TaxID=154954 RepID=UPI003F760F52
MMSDSEEALSEEEERTQNEEPGQDAQDCPLTKATIVKGLSLLCRTGNGLGHAFIRLSVDNSHLTDINAISRYIHIRFLDLSKNRLTDLSPLAALNQLLWLKADYNSLTCLKEQPLDKMAYLQWLSLEGNQLKDLEGLAGPALETLNLSGNGIQRVVGLNSSALNNLVTLELRGNLLETTGGINLPNLQRLYLAKNTINRLEGLDRLERLTTLHLRDNQVDSLEGLSLKMKSLRYLNIRGNTITDQNILRDLRNVSHCLRTLVLSDNPIVEIVNHRLWVLMYLPHVNRIDKDTVYPDERAEALEKLKELEEEEL